MAAELEAEGLQGEASTEDKMEEEANTAHPDCSTRHTAGTESLH